MRKLVAAVAALTFIASLLVSACATPTREVTVTKEVPVPYYQPCPKAEDVPAVPRRVAEEHPAMPKAADGAVDWQAVSRILGAKVLELFGYADTADGVMKACSKPR